MKRWSVVFLVVMLGSVALAQEEMVSIPKSKLTEQQKAEMKMSNAQSWVGMGKEIGDAVNSSLQAITTQSNNFAQTPVGKLTVCLVIWKVVGDQAVHILGGLLILILCVPIWIWSYRRICMTRRVKTGKDTWEVVKYEVKAYSDFTPRIAHALVGIGIMAAFAITVFSY